MVRVNLISRQQAGIFIIITHSFGETVDNPDEMSEGTLLEDRGQNQIFI